MYRVGIALGANCGELLAQMQAARGFLEVLHGGRDGFLQSSLYESSPVNCPPGSPAFLNAVVELVCELKPRELLMRTQGFEEKLGRVRGALPNAPRPIDLDILYYSEEVVRSSELLVPHPRLRERLFVLQPLAEIRPDLVLPGEVKTISEFLAAYSGEEVPLNLVLKEW